MILPKPTRRFSSRKARAINSWRDRGAVPSPGAATRSTDHSRQNPIRPMPELPGAALLLPPVFSLRGLDSLPLEVGRRIWAAAGERNDVIFDIAGAGAAGSP